MHPGGVLGARYSVAVTTTSRPETRRSGSGLQFEECEHIVSDADPDTALCGIDQTDVPWNQGFPPCQACMAVVEGRMS
jgi:hypothetical protein